MFGDKKRGEGEATTKCMRANAANFLRFFFCSYRELDINLQANKKGVWCVLCARRGRDCFKKREKKRGQTRKGGKGGVK